MHIDTQCTELVKGFIVFYYSLIIILPENEHNYIENKLNKET